MKNAVAERELLFDEGYVEEMQREAHMAWPLGKLYLDNGDMASGAGVNNRKRSWAETR